MYIVPLQDGDVLKFISPLTTLWVVVWVVLEVLFFFKYLEGAYTVFPSLDILAQSPFTSITSRIVPTLTVLYTVPLQEADVLKFMSLLTTVYLVVLTFISGFGVGVGVVVVSNLI